MKYLLLTLIFAVACCTYAAADLMDGLVLYMPLDEGTGTSTEDFSENGFTGELNGDAQWVDGKFGKALEFAAAADFVAVEDDAAFHIEDAITQAAWVNLTRLPSAHAIIFGTRAGGVGRHIGFGFGMDPANRLKVWTNGAAGGFLDVIDNSTALDTGKWYYLAYTHTSANNGLVKIYVDGELTGAVETNNPVAPAGTTNQLQICTWYGEQWLGVGWIEAWPGLVDEVRLWNRALSAEEVKESMDVGMAGFLTTSEPTPTELTSTDTVVSLKPAAVQSPTVGEELTVTLGIVDGENVAGFQANLLFDTTALRYVSGNYGAYLPAGSFHVPLRVDGNRVTLAATALAESRSGSGVLATVTFEVLEVKSSMLTLSQVSLVAPDGEKSAPRLENAQIVPVEPAQILGDANRDGVLNIQDLVLIASRFGETGENEADMNEDNVVDIVDLVLAANEIGDAAAAPTLHPEQLETLEGLSAADVQQWLTQGVKAGIADSNYQQGILYLQHLLAALIPRATALLPNYPNPFNPESWIPYQLAKPAKAMVSIHAADGKLVRTLDLGELSAGVYQDKARAAYWDGRNEQNEPVASGVYFYTLTAGDFTATRKMLIRK